MIISGLNTFSLLDYPGKIACILFSPGCNLRCHFCHNPSFVLPKKIEEIKNTFISEKEFFGFLESRVGLLDGVVICGGEPTIQKDLIGFIKRVKDMGFFVKLDTNGTNPGIIKELLTKQLIDYIAMDIKNPLERYTGSLGIDTDTYQIKKSIQLIQNSNRDYEFRTTVINGYHSKKDIEEIVKEIGGAKNYFLQNFQAGNCLKKDFDGKSFSINELQEMKDLAEKYVKNCGIRNEKPPLIY